MTLRSHVIQATVGSAILAPFLGAKTIFFFVSMILIDVDHYFTYIVVCRRFDIRGLFQFYDFIFKNKESVYGFCLFHTAEVFLLLFILGFWSDYFWIILFGFLVHFIFDSYYLYVHNVFFSRAFSIIEYISRKKKSIKGYPILPEGFWEKA